MVFLNILNDLHNVNLKYFSRGNVFLRNSSFMLFVPLDTIFYMYYALTLLRFIFYLIFLIILHFQLKFSFLLFVTKHSKDL